MAATLQTILGDGAILPHDLHPDDTTVVYDDNGNPVIEKDDYEDPDDDGASDKRDMERYIALSLAYYNGKHNTDYKAVRVGGFGLEGHYGEKSIWVKFYFDAAPSTSVECPCASTKLFCAELHAEDAEGYGIAGEVVTSCRIMEEGIMEDCKAPACKLCDPSAYEDSEDRDRSVYVSKEVASTLSKYSHYLADGVALSDKAKLRAKFPLLALAHYNKKRHADYKLVDALPNCVSYDSGVAIVAHCNFIARRNAPVDASKKLFFAELEKRMGDWVVIACSVLRGKTTAGCHYCKPRWGKRVIHPTRGFRFGLYPNVGRRCLRRRH